MRIAIDTREQKPFVFRAVGVVEGVVVKTIKTGDYSIEDMEHLIAIERKSPMDLYQTLGRGNARFQRELERASELDYFAVVIECNFSVCRDGTFKEAYRTKMRSNVIMKILGTLMLKYNFQVFFAQTPAEASSITRWLLTNYYNNKEKEIFKL